jgi:hypothetical protein
MARSRRSDSISLGAIVIDESIYPRGSVNQLHIRRLQDALDGGATFPPVVVERGSNRLVDGRHRYGAYQAKEILDVPCEFRVWDSEADLFADAVRLNAEHGQALTYYDVKLSILRLQQLGYTQDRIGAVVRMTIEKVENIIRGSAHSATTGEPIALKGGLRHKSGQALTDQQQQAMRKYAGGNVVFYVHQLITVLENDLWPAENVTAKTEMDRLVNRWVARFPVE